jgi:organic radical activating enzyme
MEHFYTIQGEGYNTGVAAYFIRLAGCDVGCFWCDVKESWDVNAHPHTEINSLVESALKYPSRMAVITGGEPLMHDLTSLTSALKEKEFITCLETSAAYPLTGTWDWICVSPHKFKTPLEEVVKAASELKVVVYNKSDFEWAEKYADIVSNHCKLFLQPEYSVFDNIISSVVEYVKQNPKWNISIQSHKVMGVP